MGRPSYDDPAMCVRFPLRFVPSLMRGFLETTEALERLAESVALSGLTPKAREMVSTALDGWPSRQLRRMVPAQTIRDAGAFFTGVDLGKKATDIISSAGRKPRFILDPTCGAGDLLISCARLLPTKLSLKATLELWGQHIMGFDLFPEFVRAAKARLVLVALDRRVVNRDGYVPDWTTIFPLLIVGDALSANGLYHQASTIVMNPPYTLLSAPHGTEWGKGIVSAAAIFLETCVRQAKPGTRIIAVLPDVLRSGSRYEKWRKQIESRAAVEQVRVFGQFDPQTDIHVFLLFLKVTSQPAGPISGCWTPKPGRTGVTVGELFDVSIGPVVDYRDGYEGPERAFASSRGLPSWGVVRRIATTRRFRGKVLRPPFVLVRRTSRPGDRHRAVGTVVVGRRPVAVENHLLVLRPRNGAESRCLELLKVLRHATTSDWLDSRIRCRHLTVSSVSEIPWRK